MLKKTENNDVIFEAGEDLYSHQKTILLLLSQTSFRIQITKSRRLQSYSFEFCGMTGLSYPNLRFQSLGRDISPDLIITTPCLIKVYHTSDFHISGSNPLKSSLSYLFSRGTFSDISLKINNSIDIKAHKCILAARSSKFEAMFNSDFSESRENIVNITCKNLEMFKLMLQWIYVGEIKFPTGLEEVFDLLVLADEYMLIDLKEKCEEDIKTNIDEKEALKILILCEQNSIISNEVIDKCKTIFIDEFDKILKQNPDLEEEIIKIPGLVTRLFSHIHAKKNNRKRKVTFVIEEHSE